MDILLSYDFFPKIGGAHHWMYETYKRWPNKVYVLTSDYSSNPQLGSKQKKFDSLDNGALILCRNGIKFYNISLFNLRFLRRLLQDLFIINKISQKQNITMHCLRAFPEGLVASIYKIIFPEKCKIVTYAHGEELLVAKTSRQLFYFAKLAYHHSDIIIANSISTKKILQNIFGNFSVQIVYPGVDYESFQFSASEIAEFRNERHWESNTIVLFSISRLEKRKNHLNVIQAVKDLIEDGYSIEYVIGGDGDEKEHIESFIETHKLNRQVHCLGQITDYEKKLLFASTDIHVMASVQEGPMIEGFGIVFLEAGASGAPSIAGNIGGQPEAVQDGHTGLIVDGKNLCQLKEAIKILADSKKLRKKMGFRAKKWALENDWNHVVKKTLTLIRGEKF